MTLPRGEKRRHRAGHHDERERDDQHGEHRVAEPHAEAPALAGEIRHAVRRRRGADGQDREQEDGRERRRARTPSRRPGRCAAKRHSIAPPVASTRTAGTAVARPPIHTHQTSARVAPCGAPARDRQDIAPQRDDAEPAERQPAVHVDGLAGYSPVWRVLSTISTRSSMRSALRACAQQRAHLLVVQDEREPGQDAEMVGRPTGR